MPSGRVVPSRFFEERASVACSSYQLLDLVASLEDLMEELRSAVYLDAVRSVLDVVLSLDEAVTTPVFFLRLLTLRPDSSSEEVKSPESESEAGGGLAARFLKLDLPLPRFLKIATGSTDTWRASIESIVVER